MIRGRGLCAFGFFSAYLIFFLSFRSLGEESTTMKAVEGPFEKLVIRGVTIIDGTGAPPMGPMKIVITRNLIQKIVPMDSEKSTDKDDEDSGNVRILDVPGAYVIPGIVDLHAHISDRWPKEYEYMLWLAHGVTSVRLLGVSNPDAILAENEASVGPDFVAPRIFLYGFWKEPKEGNERFHDVDSSRTVVREWARKGFSGIKMTSRPGLYPDMLEAITTEAKKVGLGVAVHIGQDGVYPVNAVVAAKIGVTTIEHHYGYAEAALGKGTLQNLAPSYNYLDEESRFRVTAQVWLDADRELLFGEVLDTLSSLSRGGGFTMVPTFAVYSANRDLVRAQNHPWHTDYTLPALYKSWLPNPQMHASYHYHWTSLDEALWARMFRRWMDFVNAFKNRGGHVGVGSDPGYLFQTYGFATIRELELLEEAGFHPLEVIRSATQEGARVLKQQRLGILRPGYLADLVVLTSNPLEDLKIMYGTGVKTFDKEGKSIIQQGVLYTIRNGVLFHASTLLQKTRELVNRERDKKNS